MTDARPEPPASFAFEVIVTVPLRFTPLGGLVIDTVGGVASTSQVRVVVPLVLSYASFVRTSNVCEPCDRPAYAFGLVAVVQPLPSSSTSNVTPLSASLKPKAMPVPLVEPPAGPESIDGAAGAIASTVQVRETAPEVFANASSARTWNVWEPSARPVKLRGERQPDHAPPSNLHSRS